MTKSQQEIRRLVTLRDPRIWPLYGQRIIEWSDGQLRMAARQLVDSVWSAEDVEPISAVQPDNGSKSKAAQPIFERLNARCFGLMLETAH